MLAQLHFFCNNTNKINNFNNDTDEFDGMMNRMINLFWSTVWKIVYIFDSILARVVLKFDASNAPNNHKANVECVIMTVSHKVRCNIVLKQVRLSHWGRDKWPPFSRRHFQMHFFNRNMY